MPVPKMGWSNILGSCTGGADCRSSNRGAHTPQGSMLRASSPSRQFQRPGTMNASQSSRPHVLNLGNNEASLRNRSSSSDESIGNGPPDSRIPHSDNHYLLVANTRDKTVHTFGPMKTQNIGNLKLFYDVNPDNIVGEYDNVNEWTKIIRSLPDELKLPHSPWAASKLPPFTREHYIVIATNYDKFWSLVPPEIAESKEFDYIRKEQEQHYRQNPSLVDTKKKPPPLDTARSIVPSASHNFQVRNETSVPQNVSQRHKSLAARNHRAILDPLAKSAYQGFGHDQDAYLPGQIHGGRVKKRNKAPPNHNVAKGRKTATKPRKTRS